jgi:acyl carrier protein
MITEDMVIRDALMICVKDAVDEVNTTRVEKIPTNALNEVYLYDQQGVFDSLQLVDFLMILEEKIVERVGASVAIVSERAFSRRVNPFGKVSTLVDYVAEEIAPAHAALSS